MRPYGILFHQNCDNGAFEPWLWENEWVFEIRFDFRSWFIGASYQDKYLLIHFACFSIIWWRA